MAYDQMQKQITAGVREQMYNAQHFGITGFTIVQDLQEFIGLEISAELEKFKHDADQNGEDTTAIDTYISWLLGDSHSAGKLRYTFNNLQEFIMWRYLQVPAQIVLPEDQCHQNGTKNDSTSTIESNRKCFNEIIEDKQTSLHLKQRIDELKSLSSKLAAISADHQRAVRSMEGDKLCDDGDTLRGL